MSSFRDHSAVKAQDHSPRKMDYFLAAAGHVLLLVMGTVAFSSNTGEMMGGEDAIMVRMVTPASSVQEVAEEVSSVQENPEEAVQENPEEAVQENPEEAVQENPEEIVQENPEETQDETQEVAEENPEEMSDFATVSSQGNAGGGAPGPGTYESRVFNAVRRGYRTSVTPQQSYRVILTVYPDGSTSVEVVRKSGTSAFDRAVENALSTAQIPPMPPGRNSPAVINIEFIGPE